jgi:hypothetical protein
MLLKEGFKCDDLSLDILTQTPTLDFWHVPKKIQVHKMCIFEFFLFWDVFAKH